MVLNLLTFPAPYLPLNLHLAVAAICTAISAAIFVQDYKRPVRQLVLSRLGPSVELVSAFLVFSWPTLTATRVLYSQTSATSPTYEVYRELIAIALLLTIPAGTYLPIRGGRRWLLS